MACDQTVVTVTGTTSYPTNPQVSLGFTPDSVLVACESDDVSGYIDISFDGHNDHGRATKGTPLQAIEWRTHDHKVWLKTSSGAVGAVTARVLSSQDAG